MIKTEKGITEFDGTGSEIAADLASIMQAAVEKTPVQFLIALEAFRAIPNAPAMVKDKDAETKTRIEALAALLAILPKEELEAIKKKAEEGKHDETDN